MKKGGTVILNVDVIGGKRSLTEKEEVAISTYLKAKKTKKKTKKVTKKSSAKLP
jgi:hypothetical protein